MIFLTLKLIHIASAIILFGLGCGTVFFKMMADRSDNHAAIAVTSKHVVLADWWFTTPTVIIQPLTGILMAEQMGMSLSDGWLMQSIILYILTGLCWLPVVYLQIQMRDIANNSLLDNKPLPAQYHYYSKLWMWLGVPAFFAMLSITTMMVFPLISILGIIMKNIVLLQKALGKDWGKLPSVIQRHYSVPTNATTCLQGNMEIGFPTFLLPLISLIHLCGGLVLRRGTDIHTLVEKTVSKQQAELHWKRTLTYPDNKKDYFYSKMIYLQDHELIETVRFGFGLRLKVSVEKGNLVYCSNGHIWQYGKFRITIPDWLVLGKAMIIETPISDQQFKLDFSIKHPLWGKCYWYHGVFQYCDNDQIRCRLADAR